jgi:ribosome-binding protein aMBF1 (putative translation factor)
MTVREVKRKMREKGLRQIDLARKWRLRPSTVHKFLNQEFTSRRLEKRLANELGLTVAELRNEEGKAA